VGATRVRRKIPDAGDGAPHKAKLSVLYPIIALTYVGVTLAAMDPRCKSHRRAFKDTWAWDVIIAGWFTLAGRGRNDAAITRVDSGIGRDGWCGSFGDVCS